MDNFDFKDTKSGKGSTHKAVLTIFQNQREKNEEVISTPIRDNPKNDLSTQSSNAKKYYNFVNFAEVI